MPRIVSSLSHLIRGTAARGHTVVFVDGAWRSRRRLIYDPRDFGAACDLVTDDTVPMRNCIAAAEAAGGGDIVVPYPGMLGNTVTASAVPTIWQINGSHIALRSERGAMLKTTASAALIKFNGGKTGVNQLATIYTMNAAVKGADYIELSTSGHAMNFVAGDWVFIRTGQVLDVSGGTHPDAEINQVRAIDGAKLYLRWPLAKPYALEHVDTVGEKTYGSIVGGGGSAVPIGVANATSVMTEDVRIEGITFYSRSGQSAIVNGNVYGLTIEHCAFDVDAAVTSMGVIRGFRGLHNRIQINTTQDTVYVWSPNTGCTDFLSEGNETTCNKIAYLHIHEGVARFTSHRDTIRNAYLSGVDGQAVSIRTRAYDIDIMHGHFVNAGTNAIVYVDASCTGGGRIIYNDFIGKPTGPLVVDPGSGWDTTGNRDLTA